LAESAFLFVPKLIGATPIGVIDEVVVFLRNLPMFQYEKGSSCWLLELGSCLARFGCTGIAPCYHADPARNGRPMFNEGTLPC
jgi:hypothetical protein